MLSIAGLSASYGKSEVLRDVHLNVGMGEIVALTGRNGAGKTTTLKCVMGIVRPTAGAVTLGESSLVGLATNRISRRGVAYVPEDRRVFSDLSVEDNLAIARAKNSTYSVEQVFEVFPSLRRRRSYKARALSGGEQQMLVIGRALMSRPKVILLDEPFQGLAPLVVRGLVETVKEIRDEGVSILLVEQNLLATLKLAHRHVIMDQGEVVYDGPSADLEERRDLQERYLGVG